MTTPAEFKAIKELRQIDDAGISPDLLMLFESETESLKVLLSQLASYITKPLEDELIPPGVPQYWPGDTPPAGFVFINNGLTFNTVTYPKLAVAWPTGVIPPHKGLVIECTADGAVTGESETGEIKLHGHTPTLSSADLGEKTTSQDTHNHDTYGSSFTSTLGTSRFQGGNNEQNTFTLKTSNHTHAHSVNIGSHSHQISISNTGQSRNTVDRINYNVMVRLA